MYRFILEVGKESSRLVLMEGNETKGERQWPESRDMGRQLFAALHDLLLEQDLKPEEISDFSVQTDVSDNFTSVKIAQTVARVYTWAVSVKSSSKKS